MIDIARALKTASATGDVRFGLAETRRSLATDEAKMVVFASNCPDKSVVPSGSKAKVLAFSGTNVELGNACGMPFPISVLAVVSPGESNILLA